MADFPVRRTLTRRRHVDEQEETRKAEEVEKSLLYQVVKKSKTETDDNSVEKGKETFSSQLTTSLLSGFQMDNLCKESLRTTWKPYSWFMRKFPQEKMEKLRRKFGVIVEGDNRPPLMERFEYMRLPTAILDYLDKKGIRTPTSIQMQGIPSVLSGRDAIGIAYTGSGKSMVFSIPLLLFAIEAEERLEYLEHEGPLGLIVVPSRELAKQIHEQITEMAEYMAKRKYALVRTLLCIGGSSTVDQSRAFADGVHLVVATPGRLLDLLEKKRLSLDGCRHFCLDEADRMVDLGFEDDLRRILKHLPSPRQTLLFSATMPSSIKQFAMAALINPVLINIGRAGAANKNVIQTVEWIPYESRFTALLEALQKTAPPVIVFSQNKFDVDDVQEFLLRHGVEAVGIHGGKTQEERSFAIDSFKKGQADVLVATDIASKGLDLPGIQHVINYDMPGEIEDYVHRIGRTGRGGSKGLATTFITPKCTGPILQDLKQLLLEAKQDVPLFLASIDDYGIRVSGNGDGCSICGGLGHVEAHCPKLTLQTSQAVSQIRGHDEGGGF